MTRLHKVPHPRRLLSQDATAATEEPKDSEGEGAEALAISHATQKNTEEDAKAVVAVADEMSGDASTADAETSEADREKQDGGSF